MQCLITNALQHKSKQNAFLTSQSCSAKQVDSRLVSLHIDLWVFAQHTCLQCLTTNALQHWSGQLAFLTAQSCSAKQAVNKLVSLQIDLWVFAHHKVCSDPISAHCSTDQDQMHFSLPCVALQHRVTSCWCHYQYTFVYFFNIQVSMSHHHCTAASVRTKCIPHCPQLRCKTG